MNVAANARPHIDVSSGPSRHFGAGLQGEEASRREVNEGFLPSAPGGWGPFRCGRKRLVVEEQCQDNNNGDWHADKPKQDSLTHDVLLWLLRYNARAGSRVSLG